MFRLLHGAVIHIKVPDSASSFLPQYMSETPGVHCSGWLPSFLLGALLAVCIRMGSQILTGVPVSFAIMLALAQPTSWLEAATRSASSLDTTFLWRPWTGHEYPWASWLCLYRREQKFQDYLKDYMNDVRKKNDVSNGLAEHMATPNHDINLAKPSIIAK